MIKPHLFTSTRLGFRLWEPEDLNAFASMNADLETMRYFEKPLNKEESQAMMDRLNRTFKERGYCYFAVDHLETGEFVGMIGLGWKDFEADFTPCVDIGWRLVRDFWNQGFATEGATRCLAFAKEKGIKTVFSYASKSNVASLNVMVKCGLSHVKDFELSELKNNPLLNPLCLYQIRIA